MARRIVILALLVLFLVGVCWIVGRVVFSRSPTSQLASAQRAVARGDHGTARIHLMTLLGDHPDNSEGHLLISEVILAEAGKDGEPATYQTNDEARRHLSNAARLRPDDTDLQKQLLGIFLDRGRMQAAAEVAEPLATTEPNHPDVLLALAARAIDAEDYGAAAEKFRALAMTPSHRVFQTAVHALRLYRPDTNPTERAAVLASAVKTAASTTSEQLASMDLREQLMMTELLRTAVAEAEDVPTAHERATTAVDVCEKVAGFQRYDAAVLGSFLASVMAELRRQHPLDATTVSELPVRRALQQRVGAVFDRVMQTGTASPAVYREAAFAAFDLLEHERVRSILREGIARYRNVSSDRRQQLLQLHLLAARNLIVMRRYGEARANLEALQSSSEPAISGWAQLLAGGIASIEGRYDTALGHYVQAERRLGRTPLLNIALARTLLETEQWEDALSRLAELDSLLESPDVEHKAWLQAHDLYAEDVRWGKLRAYVALDQGEAAQREIRKLRGTRREPDALVAWADYLWKQGQREQALSLLSTERARMPRHMGLLQTQVRLLQQAGRDAEAAGVIDTLSAHDDLESQLFLARWRFGEGRQSSAIELLDELGERFPDKLEPQFLKARLLLAMGKSREALAIAGQLRESPDTAAAAELLALNRSLQESDLSAAAEQMERIEDAVPSVTPGMDILAGMIAAEQGRLTESVERASKHLDVQTLRQQTQRLLLQSLVLMSAREGQEAAVAALAPLLQQHPKDAFLRMAEATLHFQNGQFADGMQALNRMEKLQPDQPAAAYLKAAAWSRARKVRRALEEIDRALTIDGSFVPAIILAARLHVANNQPQRAVELAANALADNPRIEQLYLIQAAALQQLDRRDEAIDILQTAFQQDMRLLAVYRGLLSLLLESGRQDDALQVCRQAHEQRPEQFVFVTDQIAILCRRQQLEQAEQLARQEVGDPPDPAKCLAVAKTLAALDLRGNAKAWAERALQSADDAAKSAVHLFLGHLALREGQENGSREQLAAARDHYAEVLKANPRHLAAGNNLAWLLAAEFDQIEPSLEIVERVRGEASLQELPVSFLATVGFVYRGAGKLDEARQLLERSLVIHPDHGGLMFHLGMVVADQHQDAAAVATLERALQLGGLSNSQIDEARQTLASLKTSTSDATEQE